MSRFETLLSWQDPSGVSVGTGAAIVATSGFDRSYPELQRSRRRDAPRGGLRAPLECMGPLWLCPVAPRLLPSLLDVVTRRT